MTYNRVGGKLSSFPPTRLFSVSLSFDVLRKLTMLQQYWHPRYRWDMNLRVS